MSYNVILRHVAKCDNVKMLKKVKGITILHRFYHPQGTIEQSVVLFDLREKVDSMMTGRRVIWTDEKEITAENVVSVIENAWSDFSANRMDCDFLLNYDRGNQPIQREKTYRSDIDIQTIDNVANEITTFKVGFHFGNEITLGQRGTHDAGADNAKEQDAIALLNECYSAENAKAKNVELGNFVEITGIGFTLHDINTEYEDGDSYFKYIVVDPRFAFVVKSTALVDHRVVLGVTFREDRMGNIYFTAFSKDRRYEVYGSKVQNGEERQGYTFGQSERSGDINPLGIIPLIEWERSYDRTGAWERQISDLDSLNIAESDLACLLDQNVQSIWHANDVEFAKDENGEAVTPKSNDWVMTYTTRDGKTPFITPLAVPGDYSGILTNISTKRSTILQKCNVPMRNDTSGGSTGVAMSDATGWSQAEVEASKQQAIMEGCKMDEVRVALACIKSNPYTPSDSPLLKLKYRDVQPSVKRQKNYEMVSKVNAFSVMVSHGINGLHAIRAINLFEDPQQVWEDSREMIEKYQESLVTKSTASVPERAGSDESDQIVNSPNIDGMTTQEPVDDEETEE